MLVNGRSENALFVDVIFFASGVIGRFVPRITLIWIDPVKLALRFSKSPPSMDWIQGAAGMIHDGGSL